MRRTLTIPRWLRSPVLHVAVPGVLSWLVYLHLVLAYPLPAFVARFPLTDFGRANNYTYLSLLDFIVSITSVFVLYLLACLAVRQHTRERHLFWIVIGFAVLFAVTLLVLYPITATDIFEYVFHSRILTRYGQNPLSTPPSAFKGDPFLKTVNWAVQPSPYGPLWVILTVPGSLIAANDLVVNLFMMKGLAVLFYAGCAILIGAILQRHESRRKVIGTVLFAWNPLILFEAPGNGHNGIIMMFFALLAVYLLVRKQWLWVIPALVASVLVKYVTALLLIPFLIYCLRAHNGLRARVLYLIKSGAITAVLILALALPFLAVPSGLLYEADFYSLLSIPTLAYHWIRTFQADRVARDLTFWTSSCLYILLYLASLLYLLRATRPTQLVLLGTWQMMVYLLIGSMHFQPWFVIWVIALAIWVGHAPTRRILLAFSFSALLSYAANFIWIYNYRVWERYHANIMFVMVIFVLPTLVGMLSYLWDHRLAAVWARTALGVANEFKALTRDLGNWADFTRGN